MTEEERLKAHLGEALGEAVFERACIKWCDRVPWGRALAQAEAEATTRGTTSTRIRPPRPSSAAQVH